MALIKSSLAAPSGYGVDSVQYMNDTEGSNELVFSPNLDGASPSEMYIKGFARVSTYESLSAITCQNCSIDTDNSSAKRVTIQAAGQQSFAFEFNLKIINITGQPSITLNDHCNDGTVAVAWWPL